MQAAKNMTTKLTARLSRIFNTTEAVVLNHPPSSRIKNCPPKTATIQRIGSRLSHSTYLLLLKIMPAFIKLAPTPIIAAHRQATTKNNPVIMITTAYKSARRRL